MSVKLTESAARQISKQLEKRGKGIGLKLGVRKSWVLRLCLRARLRRYPWRKRYCV